MLAGTGMLIVYLCVWCRYEEGCYKYCPAKTYPVEDTMTCVACQRDCVSCEEDECQFCEADFFLSGKGWRYTARILSTYSGDKSGGM